MAKRLLDEILTDINPNAKKQKIGKKDAHIQSDSDGPSSPVRSRYGIHRESKSRKTSTETDPGERRRSLFTDSRNGRRTSLKGGFLDESDSESSSDEDNQSQPELSYAKRGKTKTLSSSTNENMPPPVTKQSSDQNELAKTNALLHTLLKRIERQDKKISDMQLKLSQASASSSTTDSTPRRRSASDRRKEVPLEVRVSFKIITLLAVQ